MRGGWRRGQVERDHAGGALVGEDGSLDGGVQRANLAARVEGEVGAARKVSATMTAVGNIVSSEAW